MNNYSNIINLEKRSVAPLLKLKSHITLIHLFLEWSIIACIAYISEYFSILPIYILSIFVIAARMHAIASLAHEAVHYLINQDKKINDFIARVFITLPLFFSLELYRKSHMAHHSFLNSEKDPDAVRQKKYKEFQFPLRIPSLIFILLKDVLGINFLRYRLQSIFSKQYWHTQFKIFDVSALVYYIIGITLIYLLNLEFIFLKYWILPYITWLQVIVRIRAIAEHHAISDKANKETRTTLTNILDKLLFGPKNSNFHAEHHVFPTVPFYNLPKLHKILLKNDTFKSSTHYSNGYISVLKECTHR